MKQYKRLFKESKAEKEVCFSTDDEFYKNMNFIDEEGKVWDFMYDFKNYKKPYFIISHKQQRRINEYFNDNTIFINVSTLHEYKIDKKERRIIKLKMVK